MPFARADAALVTPVGNIERLGELSRAGTETTQIVEAAPVFHQRQTTPRLERANQNQPGAFAAFDQKIQHPMDAIIKVNIDRAGTIALDKGAGAWAREGMAGLVVQ